MLSAIIPGIESLPVPLYADHQRAAKFTGLDHNYVRISDCLVTMLTAISSKQPQSSQERARLIMTHGMDTVSAARETIGKPVDTGNHSSSTEEGPGLESGVLQQTQSHQYPTSRQQFQSHTEEFNGTIRATQVTHAPNRSVPRITDKLRAVGRDQLAPSRGVPRPTVQSFSQFLKFNGQTAISKMVFVANQTAHQVAGPSLQKKTPERLQGCISGR